MEPVVSVPKRISATLDGWYLLDAATRPSVTLLKEPSSYQSLDFEP
jgi:hypothetical protein